MSDRPSSARLAASARRGAAERAALRRVPARARPARAWSSPPTRQRQPAPADAAQHADRAAARPAAAKRGREAAASLPAGSQTVPSSSPPPARWGTVGSMQVPQNPAVFGPQRSERAVEHVLCARSLGCAARGDESVGGGNGGPAERAVPAARGRAHRRTSAASAQLDSRRPDPVRRLPLRLLHAGGRAGRGRLPRARRGSCSPSSRRWCGAAGDWKYLFPAGGAPAMQVIADLTGYVPWSSF